MTTRRTRVLLAATAALSTGGLLVAGLPPAAEANPRIAYSTVASGLTNPWAMTWVNGVMLFDQRNGQLFSKRGTAAARQVTLVGGPRVFARSEGGLLGIVADPGASSNRRFYTCMSTATSAGEPQDVRVLRWSLTNDTAAQFDGTLVSGIPIGLGRPSPGRHNGCALRFGPDQKLYVGTGDAAIGSASQSLSNLGGKVLRVNPDPRAPVPADNPFVSRGGNARFVWTYGHRNVQGLALRPGTSQLFSVEHGPGRDDEINLLVKGANYGWNPDGPGSDYDESVPMTDLKAYPKARRAVWASGNPTIATSGGAFLSGDAWGRLQGAMAVGVLKGQKLSVLTLNPNGGRASFETLVNGASRGYGRIRGVQQGPDGALYFTTSNSGGDRVVRLAPAAARTLPGYRRGLDVSPVGVSAARDGNTFWLAVRTTGNRIVLKRSTDNARTWSGWIATGVVSTSAPSLTSSARGRLDLVTRGTSRNAVHTWFVNGRRAGQRNLGGIVTAAPAVSSVGNGTLDVFGRDVVDGAVRKHFDGKTWSGWQQLGGVFSSAITASADRVTRVTTLAGRGSDGAGFERTVTPTGNGREWTRKQARIWSARAIADTYGSGTRVGVTSGSDYNATVDRGALVQGVTAFYNSAPAVVSRTDGSWVMFGRSSNGSVYLYDNRAGGYRNVNLGGVIR